MKWADGKIRCCWANPKNERYIRYHDEEWGIPVHDDRKLFEMLILECFQAGLSWECVLNKRDAFRKAFDNFDPEKVSAYTEDKLEALRSNPGIIRKPPEKYRLPLPMHGHSWKFRRSMAAFRTISGIGQMAK